MTICPRDVVTPCRTAGVDLKRIRSIPLGIALSRSGLLCELSSALQKVQFDRRARSDEEDKGEERTWGGEDEARGGGGADGDASLGIIFGAGSAIIPRPFEFSSFVITTNTRQMKRAKGERKGRGRSGGHGGLREGREKKSAAEKSGD